MQRVDAVIEFLTECHLISLLQDGLVEGVNFVSTFFGLAAEEPEVKTGTADATYRNPYHGDQPEIEVRRGWRAGRAEFEGSKLDPVGVVSEL